MNTSLKTLFAAAIALSFTACSTDTSKNADGSTTTTVTTPSAEQVEGIGEQGRALLIADVQLNFGGRGGVRGSGGRIHEREKE